MHTSTNIPVLFLSLRIRLRVLLRLTLLLQNKLPRLFHFRYPCSPSTVRVLTIVILQLPVVFDSAPFGSSFGQIQTDVGTTPYQEGQTVFATFVGANPRVRAFFSHFCCSADIILE